MTAPTLAHKARSLPHEGAEFARQSREFASVLQNRKLLVEKIEAKNLNHFEIVETLADPLSPLGGAAVKMLG